MTVNNVPVTPALQHHPKALVADPLVVVIAVDKVDVAPQILTAGALLPVNTRLDHPANVPMWPIQRAMLHIKVFEEAFHAPGQCGGYNPHWRYDQAPLTMREYVRSPANPYVTPSPCSTGHGRGCGCDAFHATDVLPDLPLAPSGPAPVAPSTAPQDLHYAEGEETDGPQHPPTEYDETHWNDKLHLMEAPFEADFPEDEYYDY